MVLDHLLGIFRSYSKSRFLLFARPLKHNSVNTPSRMASLNFHLRVSTDIRLKRLANDLEAVEGIQMRKALDWDDFDTIMVHSATNMLRNEMNALRLSERDAGGRGCEIAEPQSLAGRVKAALRSAGHRASKAVTLVYEPRGCSNANDAARRIEGQVAQSRSCGSLFFAGPSESQGPSRRQVRFSSSCSFSTLSETHPLRDRAAVSEAHARTSMESSSNENENTDNHCAIVVGQNMLPLSGTF